VNALRIVPKGIHVFVELTLIYCVWRNMDFALTSSSIMTRKANKPQSTSRRSNLLLAVISAIVVLLILLRMIVFVGGHERHWL